MFEFFKKKQSNNAPEITVDIHSHLLPGVDDGVTSFEESLGLIKKFSEAGYKKLIITPHIMQDFYDNSEVHLKNVFADLKRKVSEESIEIELQLAAEYYLDDKLNERITDPNEKFLTFGKNYLLFETSFMNEPFYLKEFIFNAKSRGLNPVLAHPERYLYLHSNKKLLQELIDREVLLQLNINSLIGYYSKEVKKFAEKLIAKNLISFVGSDCHNKIHFETLLKSRKNNFYQTLLDRPLLNRTL